MNTQDNSPIPTLTTEDILQYVATHEFNEIGDKAWFQLIPHGENLFRTSEYGFFSGTELTVGDILWIAVGLNKGYQARRYAAEPISNPRLVEMHQ